MAKAAGAFPNKAPNFKANPQIFEIWVEHLANVDGMTALANLDRHTASSNFFPDIADIVKEAPEESNKLLLAASDDREAQLDEWLSRAIPMPAHLKNQLKRVIGD